MISFPNALFKEETVMVKILYTHIAAVAVLTSWGTVDLTDMAPLAGKYDAIDDHLWGIQNPTDVARIFKGLCHHQAASTT